MSHESLSRRHAVAAIGLASVGAGCAATTPARSIGPAGFLASEGWDANAREYTLPPLPYAYDALEPHLDEQTMRIHHDMHHAGYVRGANKALKELARIREGQADPGLIKHWSRELAFHASGHTNHTLFWNAMAAPDNGGGGRPDGDLAGAIDRDFGSFEQFVAHFKVASAKVEGSGWGWLVYQPLSQKLLVLQGEKQQDVTIWGSIPLLGVDVWEHAYYLRYQNRRAEYIDGFMKVISWTEVARRFDLARAHA